MSDDISRVIFIAQRGNKRRSEKLQNEPAYRDTVEACIPEGIEEESLPQYVPISKVGYSLVTMEVPYPARDMFHCQCYRPDTIVGVSVKSRVLVAPSRVVLNLILIRSLQREKRIETQQAFSRFTNLSDPCRIAFPIEIFRIA